MPDRRLIYTDPVSGLPTEILAEIEVWGFGTLAARPPAGSEVGDLFWLIDGATIRPQVWDGANWIDTAAIPAGAASGNLTGSYPSPTLDFDSFNGGRFGQDFLGQKLDTPASTTSSTFQTYDTFTIPADTLDPVGVYRLAVGWTITASNQNTENESRFNINGTPSKTVLIEPSVNGSLVPLYAIDDFLGAVNVGNPIVIDLEYRKASGPGSVGIDSSVFELWRIS